MKKLLYSLAGFALAAVVFVLYALQAAGFFRGLEPILPGHVVASVGLPGPEDITVSHDGHFALISSQDRRSAASGNAKQGGIYRLDLTAPGWAPTLISQDFDQAFHPHGISLRRVSDDQYQVHVVNHSQGGHSIEVFRLTGERLMHETTLTDAAMTSPNDIVAVDDGRFYFTNDHGYTSKLGRFLETYLGLAAGNVVFFDGDAYAEVADGIAYANGVNYDAGRSLLYVASARDFEISVFRVAPDFSLSHVTDINAGTGVDNIELDADGRLWVGAHPNLMTYAAYRAGRREKAPSEVIRVSYRSPSDHDVDVVLADRGDLISATSVAAAYENLLLVGSVLDDRFLIVRIPKSP